VVYFYISAILNCTTWPLASFKVLPALNLPNNMASSWS